jgi:mono/diheme cytochrome c family protein
MIVPLHCRNDMKTIRPLLLLLATTVGIVGFRVAETNADVRRGRALAEKWCSDCHAVAPNEAAGDPAAPDFTDIAAERSATGYALRVFLRTPHATMPHFILKPDDIDDIVNYILSLKRRR